jgi:dihydroxyacetone kinase-like predicted kinase
MSSLQARVEEQFQLYLEFLGPNVVVVRNFDIPMTIEHVHNNSPSLRVYL